MPTPRKARDYTHMADTDLNIEPGRRIDIDGDRYVYQPHTDNLGRTFEVYDEASGVGVDLGWPLRDYDFTALLTVAPLRIFTISSDVEVLLSEEYPEVDVYEWDHRYNVVPGIQAAIMKGNLTVLDVKTLMQKAYDLGHDRGLGY